MKHKHNKKRNTAFLYEVLILEFAKAAISKDEKLRQKILGIILESFKKDTLMYKELQLYKELVNNQGLDESTAEKILNEVKRQRDQIDDNKLWEEQTACARMIKKQLNESSFKNFVPHFKSLATIAQVFNNSIPIKKKVILENELVKSMTEKAQETLSPIDNLVFKSFVKRFNEEYGGKLFEEQQALLQKFILSANTERLVDFKVHVSKEISRLKTSLQEALENNEEIKGSEELLESAKEVVEKLNGYAKSDVNTQTLQEILKIQNLIREINE